jgi:hypothetical protein
MEYRGYTIKQLSQKSYVFWESDGTARVVDGWVATLKLIHQLLETNQQNIIH